jgi:Tol biopolymer transport system component/DNA-binding winged helix-turn-helix (wHTH) protein
MDVQDSARRLRFGTFEVDSATGELRRSGVRIRLQEQPFRVLLILLERPGDLVTRSELRQRLWSDAEFGDFDQGINVAIKKIRAALGDDSANPRFIETLSRRGYRFIAPVATDDPTPPGVPVVAEPSASSPAPSRNWKAISIVLAVLLAAVVLLIWRRPHEYALGVFGHRSEFRVAPMTSSMGYEFAPQFSPDGKQIAYAWGESKRPPNVYVKVLGAGSPVPLVPAQGNVARGNPVWSPDGRFIACFRAVKLPDIPVDPKDKSGLVEKLMRRNANRPPNLGVYLIPAVGGEERKLFDIHFATDMVWWPDGKGFLIATRDNVNDPVSLWHYSLDGSERKRLTTPPPAFNGDTIPVFSPDGKLIAFSRNYTSGGSDIFIIPAEGGEPRRITQDAHHLRGITFTADGKELIFSSARQAGARRSLWRISINGGTPSRLSFGRENADSPVVSRVGNHLAFMQQNESSTIWQFEIPVEGAKAQDPTPLITSRQLQVGAQFSPDGSRIIFTSDRTGSWELWVCAADGSNPKQLTSFGDRQTGTPRWSPDGRLIAFDSRPDKHSDIFVIDSEGGQPRRVTKSDFDSVVPSFSRDGKWIYFSSNASGKWELWKLPLDGSAAPVQLTHSGGFGAWESFDGKTIYYSKWDQPGIFAIPVQGGPETLVTTELLPKLWGSWALVENGIYLVRPAQNTDTKELYPVISFFDFNSRKMKDLVTPKETPHPGPALAVSPDRTRILYAQPNDGGSDIMIVDNFH